MYDRLECFSTDDEFDSISNIDVLKELKSHQQERQLQKKLLKEEEDDDEDEEEEGEEEEKDGGNSDDDEEEKEEKEVKIKEDTNHFPIGKVNMECLNNEKATATATATAMDHSPERGEEILHDHYQLQRYSI